MKFSNKSVNAWLIIFELFMGSILGITFIKYKLEQSKLWSNDYLSGYVEFYIWLSLIFFMSVIPIGIIGAFKLNRVKNIIRATIYSVLFWVLSLIISVILFNFFYIGSLAIILIGIIYGFNKGIRYNPKLES